MLSPQAEQVGRRVTFCTSGMGAPTASVTRSTISFWPRAVAKASHLALDYTEYSKIPRSR